MKTRIRTFIGFYREKELEEGIGLFISEKRLLDILVQLAKQFKNYPTCRDDSELILSIGSYEDYPDSLKYGLITGKIFQEEWQGCYEIEWAGESIGGDGWDRYFTDDIIIDYDRMSDNLKKYLDKKVVLRLVIRQGIEIIELKHQRRLAWEKEHPGWEAQICTTTTTPEPEELKSYPTITIRT